jgi:hypothetical protein
MEKDVTILYLSEQKIWFGRLTPSRLLQFQKES